MLSNSEVLLADQWNKKLKKLNSSYKEISHCNVPEYLYSVCYIGNNTVVVGLRRNFIQYVNVSNNISLRQLVKLDHECYDLACHDDTLYICSGDTIYKYDKYCKQKQVIYYYRENLDKFYRPSIGISDNGERLYFGTNKILTTIDAKGNHIFSEQLDIDGICFAGDGIVLALDETNNLQQLDYNGKKHRTVNGMSLHIFFPPCMCFDRERCRLIVGGDEDRIYVYKCEFLSS
jgi:hypothetical protein